MRCLSIFALLAACGGVSTDVPDAGDNADARQASPDAPDAMPVEPNLVFVTSTAHTGAIGGLAAADAICNQRATEAGLEGTYVAWMSNQTNDARDRVGVASGWVRVDGLPFTASVDDLLAGRIYYPVALDESGGSARGTVWTATGIDGRYDDTGDCVNWASEARTQNAFIGNAYAGHERFSAHRVTRCDIGNALMCFGIDREATVQQPQETGRIAFISSGRLNGTVGVSAYDAMCTNEAVAAGLTGTFLSAVATSDAPINARFDSTRETWVRPDGVKLMPTADVIETVAGDLLAPIGVTADGLTYVNSDVWTGAAGWTGTNPNCSDFTSEAPDAIIGEAALAGLDGISFGGSGCAASLPVYCFEQ